MTVRTDGARLLGRDARAGAGAATLLDRLRVAGGSRARGENVTLNVYLQQMDLASKAPVPKPGAVRCMTVHGAKGLEFRHVYLIGMAQEVFPSFQALRKGAHSRELEEERRNCFAAITRAERTLTLTRAERYYGYPKPPSQFLAEMGIGAGTGR